MKALKALFRWADSLFGRLALLLGMAVLASHLLVLNVVLDWVMPQGPDHAHPPPPHHVHDTDRPPPPPRPDEVPGNRLHGVGPWADIGVRLVLLLVAVWVGARWLTRPLSELAQAAKALSEDQAHALDRPDLPEVGPSECRETTRVFNHMQQRIRQQMAEKDRFLAAVSHDLRTPLTRMKLRMIQMPPDAHTEGLRRDVADMQQLVDATLEHFMGLGQAPAGAWVDVASLLHSLVDDLQDTGHAVTVEGDAPAIHGQPVALRRCFQNILSNAVQHGQTVAVTVQALPEGRVAVTVADDGPGVPEVDLQRILEPYQRVDESRRKTTGGVGLGLSIARDVVQRHGGTLLLLNRPTRGLEVRVEL